MLKQLLKKYEAPTPAKWRRIGDLCLLIGATITEYLITINDAQYAKFALFFTVLGKVITNFAAEESPAQ